MAKIAIMGYGTVGAGVFKTLTMNREAIARRTGEEIEIKTVEELRADFLENHGEIYEID